MTERTVPIQSNGRVVGEVCGLTFKKRVRGTQHMLRQPRAWAIDVEALKKAVQAGARHLRIEDQESGITYETALADFVKRGVRFNRGHGDQIYLPLGEWTQSGKGKEQRYEQLSLLP